MHNYHDKSSCLGLIFIIEFPIPILLQVLETKGAFPWGDLDQDQ